MPWQVTQFADLPVTKDVPWDPRGRGRTALMNELLGDPPNWSRYRSAHLVWNPEEPEVKSSYKLPIGRMEQGRARVIFAQLGAAVAALNGARGGIDLPRDVRERAFNHALRYYRKLEIPRESLPVFRGSGGYGQPVVMLENADLGDDEGPRWVQIAHEGQFLGYFGGQRPFEFTREIFEQVVRNLHANKSFKAGPDGLGIERVIPWDFDHVSEMDPTLGNLPAEGAPAQGWTYDLEIRDGADGKAELWALAEFLEPARSHVKAGRYRWASVSIAFNAVDRETGEPIGAVLTSIALTNQPFLDGMQKLVASRVAAGIGAYYGAASNATEALGCLKELFSLGELAGAPEVLGELQKLQQWITTGAAPTGVDVQGLVSAIRRILNLEALMPEPLVMDRALMVLNRLLEEQAAGQAPLMPGMPEQPVPILEPTGAAASVQPDAAAAAEFGGRDMDIMETLAKLLGVNATEREVTAAVEEGIELRNQAATVLCAGKKNPTNSVLLQVAEEGMAAREKLVALLKALGVEDAEGAVAKVTDLLAQAEQLRELMPELEELRQGAAEAEEAAIEGEVSEAMASRKLPGEVKDALVLLRRQNPERFAELYPKLTPDQVALSKDVATQKGAPIKPEDGKPADEPASVIDLAGYKGANTTQRAVAYLSKNQEGFARLRWEDQFVLACQLKAREDVIDSRVQ